MYILNQLIAVCNIEEISKHSSNNLWEHECDILLLDLPVKVLHPIIYKLARKNRLEFIKTDENMSVLLGNSKNWIAVVELLRKSKEYRDEDVLIMGAQALELLQIHRSLRMVKLVLRKITR